MRVIAGTARRLNLVTIPGDETRPTTDRIKETLFNMLQNDIPGCRFLDLFAGSGGIGIEALSRGASYAAFVEKNPRASECIKKNLAFTRLSDRSRLLTMDVFQGLRFLEKEAPFDIIFMDPPYGQGLAEKVLSALGEGTLLHPDSLIIVEENMEASFDYLEDMPFSIVRIKDYKTNRHVFVNYHRP